MTNSEKIKAYLDAGHKVKVGKYIIYGHVTDLNNNEESFFISDSGLKIQNLPGKISIHHTPLRYPKVGDKVVILESARLQGFSKHVGEVCIVAENNHYGCLIFIETTNNKHLIDYRHLAPYIE